MENLNKAIFCLALVAIPTVSIADAIDDCVEAKQRAYEQPKAFSKSGRVTCPPADIVGFPPRERKHNRNATIVYEAPTGFSIKNNSVSSIQVKSVSDNSGSVGNLSLQGNSRVSVNISCSGRGVGQGRAWQEIRIEGTIVRLPTTDHLKQWIRECIRAESN
jgi:hypothetical protein